MNFPSQKFSCPADGSHGVLNFSAKMIFSDLVTITGDSQGTGLLLD
jgi:hypothetical protein